MRLFLAAINLFSTTYRFCRCTFASNMSGASSTLTQHQGNERAVLNACWFFAFEAYYSREGVMYLIWILMGLPIASLLCAAFIVMRDHLCGRSDSTVCDRAQDEKTKYELEVGFAVHLANPTSCRPCQRDSKNFTPEPYNIQA